MAGLVAGAVGIAASELLAGLVPGVPSLVVAVGSLVIALQPPGAKDAVATLFGTNDKTALTVAVVVVALLVAAAAGILGRRSFGLAAQLLVAFGFVAFVAAALQPLNSPVLAAVNAAVATAASIATLRILLAEAGFLAPLRLGLPGSDRAGSPIAAGDATSLSRAGLEPAPLPDPIRGLPGRRPGPGGLRPRAPRSPAPRGRPGVGEPAGAGRHRAAPDRRRIAGRSGDHSDRHPQRQLLPHRHRAARAAG